MVNPRNHRNDEMAAQLEANLDVHERQGVLDGRIIVDDWAGGIVQERASVPFVRIGSRWFNSLWVIPIGAVGMLVAVGVAQHLRDYSWMQDFIERNPGTSASYVNGVDSGFPWWLRVQHFFNLFLIFFIIRSGLQILADHPRLYFNADSQPGREWMRLRGEIPKDRLDPSRPDRVWTAKKDAVALPRNLGLPGFRHSIGLARWWHFSVDVLWLANGVLFFILLFTTGQWQRLVPRSLDVFPNAISTMVQYLSLQFPANESFVRYNALQLLAYFITVFIAAPLALVTGLLQAPSIAARFGLAKGPLNRQVARSVHFGVLVWMVTFIIMHVTMVFTTGAVQNLNHITLGGDGRSLWAVAIFIIWMAIVVAAWVSATPATIAHPRTVQRVGKAIVGRFYGLLEWTHPKATYSDDDISGFMWPNGHLPESEEYRRLQSGGWKDYRLRIVGLVENPVELSYNELLAMPKHEQTTQQYCVQGWSGIAKWGGVAMSDILDLVRPTANANWAVFYSFAEGPETPGTGRYYDCHPIDAMRDDLSILAYEMNGEPLLETYGAPLRLRNELELGFKQVKWIEAIEFVESFEHLGAGQGGYNEDQEFFGYRAPI